jgi:hypothetical protein
MLPTKFRIIWLCGFRGEDFKKSANQKQELPVALKNPSDFIITRVFFRPQYEPYLILNQVRLTHKIGVNCGILFVT